MEFKHKHYLWLDVDGEDTWFSVNTLVNNLEECYQEKLDKKLIKISIPSGMDKLKKVIESQKITSVIIASPRLNVYSILKFLDKEIDLPLEYLIHVIGSPIQKLEELKKMKLEKFSITLLAGSKVNYEILKKYCSTEVKYFPFLAKPIEAKKVSENIKNKFIYFGRISYQKNILGLMDLFAEYQEKINPNAELSIYGGVCNTNFPTKPMGHYIGMSGERFFERLSFLQGRGCKIKYFGLLPNDQINTVLKEHNTFVSLSTAEEEDFGLSIWESLNAGLSCVVSKWGGHKEFENIEGIEFLDIAYQENTLYINKDNFFDALKNNNSTRSYDLQSWIDDRKKQINDLNLDATSSNLEINLEIKMHTEEFFNEYGKDVSSYWR